LAKIEKYLLTASTFAT